MNNEFDHQLLQRHAFGLVDPSTLADLPAGTPGTPIVPRELEASAHLMPLRIDCHTLSQVEADALLACVHRAWSTQGPPPVRLFIETDLSASEFTSRWNMAQLPRARGGQLSWLRLHDPRVLHQLLRILEPGHRQRLLGPFRAITYWLGGRWCTLRHASDCSVDRSRAALSSTFQAWNWSRIEDIGILNRALLAAGIHAPDEISRSSALMEDLLERARTRFRLSSQVDLVEFAVRGVTNSAIFDNHPDVAAAINDIDEESTLPDRLALIDDQVWLDLRQTPNFA